jgi:hypothetical protein
VRGEAGGLGWHCLTNSLKLQAERGLEMCSLPKMPDKELIPSTTKKKKKKQAGELNLSSTQEGAFRRVLAGKEQDLI